MEGKWNPAELGERRLQALAPSLLPVVTAWMPMVKRAFRQLPPPTFPLETAWVPAAGPTIICPQMGRDEG